MESYEQLLEERRKLEFDIEQLRQKCDKLATYSLKRSRMLTQLAELRRRYAVVQLEIISKYLKT